MNFGSSIRKVTIGLVAMGLAHLPSVTYPMNYGQWHVWAQVAFWNGSTWEFSGWDQVARYGFGGQFGSEQLTTADCMAFWF